MDPFDAAALRLDPGNPRERRGLVRLARTSLEARGDEALGLGPLRVLPRPRHDAWVLLWAAARRVDDELEGGKANPRQLLHRLEGPLDGSFAERCVAAFLVEAEWIVAPAKARALLARAVRGLAHEARFTRPRPAADYWRLLRSRSAPAMILLDHLLFLNAAPRAIARHALFFAAATQVGDDCRDAVRDLARGRCFVTEEEVAMLRRPGETLPAMVARVDFARLRTAWSRQCLDAAASVAERFSSPEDRAAADRLDRLWRTPLEAGQVRATEAPLDLSQRIVPSAGRPRTRQTATAALA